MNPQQLAGYVGSAIALVFGGALLWFPPAALGAGGAIPLGVALIVGGLAGVGVTVTVPVVHAAGQKQGEANLRLARKRTKKPPLQ